MHSAHTNAPLEPVEKITCGWGMKRQNKRETEMEWCCGKNMRWNLEKSKDFEIDELHLHACRIYFDDTVTKSTRSTTHSRYISHIVWPPPAVSFAQPLWSFCLLHLAWIPLSCANSNTYQRHRETKALHTHFAFINNNQCSRERGIFHGFVCVFLRAIPLKVMCFNLPKA